MKFNSLFIFFVLLTHSKFSIAIEFKGLQFFFQIISGDFMESKKTPEKFPAPSAQTKFSFIDYITHKDKTICGLDTQNQEIEKSVDGKKVIKVKCKPEKGNGTLYLIDSLAKMNLLLPIGNSMKPDFAGNCVVMLFYSKTCAGSSLVIPHYNALARNFHDIKVAAIDAFEFHALNTEFGIIGVPTIILFHQGRPITKFNNTLAATVNNFIKFIEKHTDLKATSNKVFVTSVDFSEPLSSHLEAVTDYYLYLSWIFIIVCSVYYFTKSKFYTTFIEQLKRNWRESEEILQN